MSKFMFTVAQDAFVAGLKAVAKAVSTKNTIPVLSGIHLNVIGGKVLLRATDMELELATQVDAQAAGSGEIVLPAKFLSALIDKLPMGTVTVEVELKNFTAEVKSGKSKYTIHGFCADQFPAVPNTEGYAHLTIKQSVLKDLARYTTFATSKDESKPWLMGVLLTLQDTSLIAMATDGVRISHAKFTVENPDGLNFKVIVPGGSLKEAADLCKPSEKGGDGEYISLAVGENRVEFITEKVKVGTRLLEGQYPDVMRLVPQGYPQVVALNKVEVLESLDRASVVAKDNAVKLAIGAETVRVTSGQAEVGQTYEELTAELVSGDSLDIGFNVKYLVEGLKAIHAPHHLSVPAEGEEPQPLSNFVIEMTGARNPARLRSKVDDTFTYIVLPLITY